MCFWELDVFLQCMITIMHDCFGLLNYWLCGCSLGPVFLYIIYNQKMTLTNCVEIQD